MKLYIDTVDKSDVIFSLDGLELRQNIGCGYVCSEINFQSTEEFDMDQLVYIYNDSNISIGCYYMTYTYYNPNVKLYEYKAMDVLYKLNDIMQDTRSGDPETGLPESGSATLPPRLGDTSYFNYVPEMRKHLVYWYKTLDNNGNEVINAEYDYKLPKVRAYKLVDIFKYYIYLALYNVVPNGDYSSTTSYIVESNTSHFDGEHVHHPLATPTTEEYRDIISAPIYQLYTNPRKMDPYREPRIPGCIDNYCLPEDNVSLMDALNCILISMNGTMFGYNGKINIRENSSSNKTFDQDLVFSQDFEKLSQEDACTGEIECSNQDLYKYKDVNGDTTEYFTNKKYQYPNYYYENNDYYVYKENGNFYYIDSDITTYVVKSTNTLDTLDKMEICVSYLINSSNNPNWGGEETGFGDWCLCMTKWSGIRKQAVPPVPQPPESTELPNGGSQEGHYVFPVYDYHSGFDGQGTMPLRSRSSGTYNQYGVGTANTNLQSKLAHWQNHWTHYNYYHYYNGIGSKSKIGWSNVVLKSNSKRTTIVPLTSSYIGNTTTSIIPIGISVNVEDKEVTIEETL